MSTWSEENDIKLWSLRSKPTSQLATTFNKTAGAIRSRLKHLQGKYVLLDINLLFYFYVLVCMRCVYIFV